VDALLPDGASGNTSQRFVLPVDPDLRRFAREIMAPGGAAGLRGLRIEARVMDMIAGQLSLLRPGADGDQRGDEGTRVAEAVELLCADLCSPPSPRALARVVGMSERQLQAAFRERLGASVAEYLREQRLAQAHHRLCNDAMSVSEVAERVGYANASNLIKALRRRFGASPSDLRGGAARTTSTGTSGALRARIPDEG
jgi:transcriptional regulator GlxA family with amidase domain